jgi:protein-L-isoaspartate(D-aspartate) O-methyltransferase
MHPSDSASARRHMVDSQLAPNKVTDARIKAAMGAVPRERFVPKAYTGVAYMDEDIPCAPGRFLMEPMVFARLLQAAEIGAQELVLDVGCGTGYSVAVLARLAGTVVGLESDKTLSARAGTLLSELGVDNAAVVQGGLEAGLPDQGPFNVILLEGAIEREPDRLLAQLAEGGRLLAVMRGYGVGKAMLWLRQRGRVLSRVLFDASVPRLPGFAAARGFVF